jgi:DNA-binding MarR family transcriptional regulator
MKASESRFCKCLYFTSQALARKVDKLAQESWAKVDLSPSHAYLLMMVTEEPGIQPGRLARHLQLQASTVTRLIDKLQQKKLITRSSEGKMMKIFPTAKARETLPRLRECLHEFYSRYSEILGKEESARLVSSMGRIADRLGG